MEKELKFRAFGDNYMHYVTLNDLLFTDGNYVTTSGEGEHYYKVMQYTGLKDKNGKEIYEGDVVNIETYYRHGEFSKRIVSWNESGAWNIFNITSQLTEVLGNIYENPELLPEENKAVK